MKTALPHGADAQQEMMLDEMNKNERNALCEHVANYLHGRGYVSVDAIKFPRSFSRSKRLREPPRVDARRCPWALVTSEGILVHCQYFKLRDITYSIIRLKGNEQAVLLIELITAGKKEQMDIGILDGLQSGCLTVCLILIIQIVRNALLFMACMMCERVLNENNAIQRQLRYMLLRSKTCDKGAAVSYDLCCSQEPRAQSDFKCFNVLDVGAQLPIQLLAMICTYAIVLTQFDDLLGF
ncbi:hypothetical protein EVAR_61768_1 [Eumeta japonica]|uniref:Uncharacterized protein n=1 Tax=Eumeta variegata TaxID=151549 RepID=A0A4C1Z1G5_EUMVA|nr:hypothetical protein EVAR_61768_1 [Eumeta japonica]